MFYRHDNLKNVRFFDGSALDYYYYRLRHDSHLLGMFVASGQICPGVEFTANGGYWAGAARQTVVEAMPMWLAQDLPASQRNLYQQALADYTWSNGLSSSRSATNRLATEVALPNAIQSKLDDGGVVAVSIAWKGHALGLTFFKLGNDVFMIYANRGYTPGQHGSGLTLY